MIIKILGTESLGVRGLSSVVELKDRKIVIDPGIALGWNRYGFLPHPFQVAIGIEIRKKIIEELKDATDIIFSHFDGDHVPLIDANPYQLKLDLVKESLSSARIWAEGPEYCPEVQKRRREAIEKVIKKNLSHASFKKKVRGLPNIEGKRDGPLMFSLPVPHGQQESKKGSLIMTRIEENREVFVHASDIQLLNSEAVKKILNWEPNIVLASGPPLYHLLPEIEKEKAWQNAIKLSENVDTLILDHHLLRSEEGVEWLKKLAKAAKNKVVSAADFMGREPLFLEAWRRELYQWLPVSKDWHEDYEQGKVNCHQYRIKGWEVLIQNKKIKPCKWYYSCPIVEYTEQGKLDRYWIENYCLVGNKNCLRYQMEEKRKFHPNNMLPNGEIREDLR